jgi:hypothetical protein
LPFEPFSVQCLTCGSSLRVTEPSAVGTIAACPRCKSMVQIDRAGHQIAVGASDVDSQAITEDSIPAPEETDSEPSGRSLSGFVGSELIDEATAAGVAPDTVPPAWQSERTARSRQIALVVAVSVTGLLAAALLFSWFVWNWSGPPAMAEIEPGQSAPLDSNTETLPSDPQDLSQDEDSPSPQSSDPSHEDVADAVGDAGDGGNPNSDAVETTDAVDEGNLEAAGDAPQENQGDPASPSADTTSVPADLLQSPTVALPDAQDDGAGLGQMMELPPGLGQYSIFLEPDGPVDLRPTIDAPPTLDEIEINAATQEEIDPMLAATPPAKINVKADLAIKMALDSDGYRLADLVLLMSQLTSVPIQLDWVSFDLVGVDVHQLIPTPKTRLKPANELLDEIAASLGAEIRPADSWIELTPSDATFRATLSEVTGMDDFGSGRTSAVNVLNEFLQGEQADPSATELTIGATRQDEQFAIIAVESLRRMRGLPAKVSDPLYGHWAQNSEEHSTEWPIFSGGVAGNQSNSPLSVAGLIRRTSKLNQCSAVVYWSDATRRQLSPTKLLLPHADSDAAAVFARLLGGYGLQVRRVDSNRWWIGTAATYDRAKVVVWTKPLGDQADTLKSRILGVMAGRDTFRVTLDPQSDRAILLLPRYIVRQLPKIQASVAAN